MKPGSIGCRQQRGKVGRLMLHVREEAAHLEPRQRQIIGLVHEGVLQVPGNLIQGPVSLQNTQLSAKLSSDRMPCQGAHGPVVQHKGCSMQQAWLSFALISPYPAGCM